MCAGNIVSNDLRAGQLEIWRTKDETGIEGEASRIIRTKSNFISIAAGLKTGCAIPPCRGFSNSSLSHRTQPLRLKYLFGLAGFSGVI